MTPERIRSMIGWVGSQPGAGAEVRAATTDASAGERLFARYAYAPNQLGYCGPAESAALFDLGVTGRRTGDVVAIARRFSGAWPYLALLAELTGHADPLDEAVVRAYWTGSDLLDGVDRDRFGVRLLDIVGAQAGHYWAHLNADLLPEAIPTHNFHVFGVYPWSRMLHTEAPEKPLEVLDRCRIRWGQVVGYAGEHVTVRTRLLTWDGCALGLGAPTQERVRLSVDGRGFVAEPQAGEWLALHWDWVCDRLSAQERDALRLWTGRQLRVTNARLVAAGRAGGLADPE